MGGDLQEIEGGLQSASILGLTFAGISGMLRVAQSVTNKCSASWMTNEHQMARFDFWNQTGFKLLSARQVRERPKVHA